VLVHYMIKLLTEGKRYFIEALFTHELLQLSFLLDNDNFLNVLFPTRFTDRARVKNNVESLFLGANLTDVMATGCFDWQLTGFLTQRALIFIKIEFFPFLLVHEGFEHSLNLVIFTLLDTFCQHFFLIFQKVKSILFFLFISFHLGFES
jgi:hypothetical protein